MDVGNMVGGTMIFVMLITAVSVIVPIGLTIGIFVYFARKKAERQHLVATGIPAQAMVVQMGDTGVRINDQPQLSLMLDVHPYAGHPSQFQPFRTSHTATIPMMAMSRVAPGMAVPVKLDPANPSRLTIDWNALGYAV